MNWEMGSLAREEEVSISYTGLRFLLFTVYLLQDWKTFKYKEQQQIRFLLHIYTHMIYGNKLSNEV